MPPDRAANFNAGAAGGLAQQLWASPPAPTAESPEIVFVRSYSIDDGRYINNGWLQELPDPVTKLTWDNAALMSPNLAKHLDVVTGDLIRVVVTDAARDENNEPIKRELVIAALVSPGHADNSITIPFGYGRRMPGFEFLPYAGAAVEEKPAVAEQSGFNAYLLRTVANPHFVVADGKTIESVVVEKAGGTYPLSVTQEHWSIEGRGLVREATLDHYREDNEFVKKIAGDDELPPKLPSLYSHPPLNAEQQWGMTVDLNVCTGCSACVIACQAENNIPVVGKLQVSHGRAMHWIRIDRYYASEKVVQSGQSRVAGESRNRARADDVPALRKRAVRNGLPGQRHRPQRGRPQRHGLQSLRRHALLREQLPVQSSPLQLFRLQPAAGRQKENRRTVRRL